MSKNRVTAQQVAKQAGVSQTTVSFVLNNVEKANISEATRERVLQAARELGYVPDVMARSLARGKSNNIALVLAQPHPQVFIDEYIPKILTGITQATQQHGLRILVEIADSSRFSTLYAELLNSREAAGMIVNFNHVTDEDVNHLVSWSTEELPVVSLMDIHPQVCSVEVDKLNGVRKVMQHLLNLGHRRIACIPYAPKNSNRHVEDRLHLYRRVLEIAGIAYDDDLVRHGNFDPDTGYAAMKSLLEVRPLPTAVFAMNDMMAFGATAAIHEAGLRVPHDMAVVGFDDVRLAEFMNPPLTTMHEPDVEHGFRAGEMLIKLIQGEPVADKHIKLPTKLVIRESCGYKLRHP